LGQPRTKLRNLYSSDMSRPMTQSNTLENKDIATAIVNTPQLDEHQLIDRLISGDNKAFKKIIGEYHSLMLNIARAIAGDTFADDVVQEAWVSVYKNIVNFERRSSLKTWLLTIVSNQAKARLRKESRHISLDQLDGEVAGSYLDGANFKADGHWQNPTPHWSNESPDALLEEKQLQHCISKTLEILPIAQKAAFILRDIEQQSFDDICSILEVSSANVRVLVHRARLTLMQMIDRYQETGSC
jgi:RNA polymerase sigma-70 factor, ECF subfamily